ncbi:hypothetical protein GCM10007079_09880 [Nocardiopsis terrae]|uniref:Uncharacterized protein n=1 Tax=Nocardiopsis terrae TaxID=372655 RepID=A0ABR9HCQ4_9ACTN|nr:hypothetical protein [Nocardiopsis terrae]GHC75079.1 hypothetical protein GCM10007079_09880 [Nocardiopsis terrae]
MCQAARPESDLPARDTSGSAPARPSPGREPAGAAETRKGRGARLRGGRNRSDQSFPDPGAYPPQDR